MRILAIDQGTTNTKALVVDDGGVVHARTLVPSTSIYPCPGWAEQSAEGIWAATRTAIDTVAAEVDASDIAGIAISNQRETIIAWDAATGAPAGPAILWQDSRTADECEALIAAGHDGKVRKLTGLGISPMFPAAKIGWIVVNSAEARTLFENGRLRVGTVDAWVLWKLTAGAAFATDHSNASRTQLFDTARLAWSPPLCELFGVPLSCLPEPMPSDSRFGETAAGTTALPAGIPVHAMMGDSHAALYGHGVRAPGTVKATYGTGSSLMTLTPERVTSKHGLSGTIGWTDRTGTAYALEGNIFVSAQAAAYMGQMLGIGDAAALSKLAETVDGADGVTFVPALSGLGAPHWDDRATGTISGLSYGTRPAHLARATFEAIALQIADVFAAMAADIGCPLAVLRADGGASANPFLMQLQSDLLGCPVDRAEIEEVGALGAAAMAFNALGAAPRLTTRTTRFSPKMPAAEAQKIHNGWREAIRRVRA